MDDAALRGALAAAEPLSIAPLDLPALAVLRLYRPNADEVADVSDLLGLTLAVEANRWADATPATLRLGPGEWLIRDGAATAEMAGRLAGRLHHVSDIRPGCVGWRAWGSNAAELIASGCSIDLHPRAFPARAAARTLLAGVAAIISRPEDEAGFEIVTDRSVGAYLGAWLADAAEGFAP